MEGANAVNPERELSSPLKLKTSKAPLSSPWLLITFERNLAIKPRLTLLFCPTPV